MIIDRITRRRENLVKDSLVITGRFLNRENRLSQILFDDGSHSWEIQGQFGMFAVAGKSEGDEGGWNWSLPPCKAPLIIC